MVIYRACLTLLNSSNRQNLTILRYVRNPLRRGGKLLKGSVKSNDEWEGNECSKISTYQDVMKRANPEERIYVERALVSEDDFGAALGKQNVKEYEVRDESFIRKKTIGNKHFKMLTLETCLLTCAAKEQIRHLHQLNPDEWTPEALSAHFPITVKGVKKLLKSYFALKDPDKIKKHDAEVEERWRALESEEPSELITPCTRQMWNEGRLEKLNYKSNPSLPSAPEERKTIILRKPAIGEFSSIVQQYVSYKTKTETKVEACDVKEVMLSDRVKNKSKDKLGKEFKFHNYNYQTENEDRNPDHRKVLERIDSFDDLDIVHSQYKTNMKEEQSPKEITSDPHYAEWMEEQTQKREPLTVKKTHNAEVFIEIPKFKDSEHLKYNTVFTENNTSNHKPGLENKNKTRYRKSPPTSSKTKDSLFRKGQNVYDEHGQFLYKVPFNA